MNSPEGSEITSEHVDIAPLPPLEPPKEAKKNGKPKPVDPEDEGKEGKEVAPTKDNLTPEIKAIRSLEDQSLKDVLDNLGPEGSFRVRVTRIDPEEWPDPATGKMVKVGGMLKTYTQAIDEEFIQKKHGGGRFNLKFTKKQPNGQFNLIANRMIDISGDPRTDDVPRNQPAVTAQSQSSSGEPPTLIKQAMDAMQKTYADALARAEDSGDDAGVAIMQQMMAMMQTQLLARETEMSQMRRDFASDMDKLRTAAAQKPPEDGFKDRYLEKLIDGDSARVTAVRAQYESQIGVLQENMRELERRLRDQMDRDRESAKQSHEREIANVTRAHDIAMAAVKMSYDTQVKILEGTIRSLERTETEIRSEVKDLRAKKDKSIVEQVKEMAVIKEALGVDDDDDDKSVGQQILDVVTNPDAMKAARELVRGPATAGAAATNTPAAANAQQKHKRQVVKTKDGQKFILEENGSLSGPLRTKAAAQAAADGVPNIDPGEISRVVGLLEKAFDGKQDPGVVAQTGKSMVPEAIMVFIRDHGVDDFMAKVAKLPSSSSLSTLAGKNWVRAVGKALVGE